jgi:xyloglucan-specific endo-beta-1,4-glucanase
VQNCGACGHTCLTGQTCNAGVCACPGFQSVCGTVCRDLNTDPVNCGTCGTRCGAGTQCLFGGCIDPTSVNCGGGPQVGMSCNRDAFVLEGKYWVNNNWWGVSTGITGTQCVWGTCQTGDLVGWGTSWDWRTGAPNAVKTYASLILGWQFGTRIANTGLPVQLSATQTINCGWSFNVTQTGTIDVAYDTWLHSIPNAGSTSTPTEEVMIWLYSAGGAGPIGPVVAPSISLAGTTWDLHEGPGGASWPVASYVRTTNATTSVMNMMDFYRDLVTRGFIPNTRYLSSIQAGVEVFNGTGQIDTNGYYCRVQ